MWTFIDDASMHVLVFVGFLWCNDEVVALKVLLMCFMIMSRDWLLEMKQILCRSKIMLLCRRNHVLCRNQSIGSEAFSRPIDWMKFLCMEKWKMFGANRLDLSNNQLYYLSVLKKMKFLQDQSIGSGLQSIAQTYWPWKNWKLFSCQSIDTEDQSIDPLHSLKNRNVR